MAAVDVEEKAQEKYCRYLPIRIGKTTCSALVDSGNLWRNVMSRKFFDQLGLTLADVRKCNVRQVSTAKKGSHLKVVGELAKPIHINLGGLAVKFKTRPVIVEGLAMPFNVSGPFLKLHGIDQIHSRDCLKVQGHEVPLLHCRHDLVMPGPEMSQSAVYACESVTVPALSSKFLRLRAVEVEKKAMPPGEGILEGGVEFMDRTDLHPWINSIVICRPNGTLIGGVMNTLDQPIKIQEGQKYGSFTRTCRPAEQTKYPWRICTLEKEKDAEADRSRKGKFDFDELEKKAAAKAAAEGKAAQEDRNAWPKAKKRKWLQSEFHLQDSPILRKQEEVEEATDLLMDFWDVFSHDGSFGKTHLIKHHIYTKPDQPPIKTRHRPLNPALEKDLDRQLAKWERNGVIEPSTSPWNFALVAAPKKGGTIRWCVGAA